MAQEGIAHALDRAGRRDGREDRVVVENRQLGHGLRDDTLRPMVNRRPQLRIVAPAASDEEAAAVVAALERFMRDTAPPPAPVAPARDPWQRAALLEATGREPAEPSPWGDPFPWG